MFPPAVSQDKTGSPLWLHTRSHTTFQTNTSPETCAALFQPPAGPQREIWTPFQSLTARNDREGLSALVQPGLASRCQIQYVTSHTVLTGLCLLDSVFGFHFSFDWGPTVSAPRWSLHRLSPAGWPSNNTQNKSCINLLYNVLTESYRTC